MSCLDVAGQSRPKFLITIRSLCQYYLPLTEFGSTASESEAGASLLGPLSTLRASAAACLVRACRFLGLFTASLSADAAEAGPLAGAFAAFAASRIAVNAFLPYNIGNLW